MLYSNIPRVTTASAFTGTPHPQMLPASLWHPPPVRSGPPSPAGEKLGFCCQVGEGGDAAERADQVGSSIVPPVRERWEPAAQLSSSLLG